MTWGSLSEEVSIQGGLCPGGSLSRGGLCLGVSLLGRPPYGNERAVRILQECILLTNSCETSIFFLTIKDNIKNLPLQEAKGNDCFAQIPICMFFACHEKCRILE